MMQHGHCMPCGQMAKLKHTLSKCQRKNAKNHSNEKLIQNKRNKMQSKDLRRNTNHLARDLTVTFNQQDKAKHNNCTIAHVISNKQLSDMKKRATVIQVKQPWWNHQDKKNKDRGIFWIIIQSQEMFYNSCTTSVIIVTTYDQISHDPRIHFVGAFQKTPTPNSWILLCVVHQ